MGADATLAGRDLAHLMPQLAVRVVVAGAGRRRGHPRRRRAPAWRGSTPSGSAPCVPRRRRCARRARRRGGARRAARRCRGRLRTGRTPATPGARRIAPCLAVPPAIARRAGRRAAGRRLDARRRSPRRHGAVRLVAAVAARRRRPPARGSAATAAVPEGRLLLGAPASAAPRSAVTAHVTADAVDRALDGLPARSAGRRPARGSNACATASPR